MKCMKCIPYSRFTKASLEMCEPNITPRRCLTLYCIQYGIKHIYYFHASAAKHLISVNEGNFTEFSMPITIDSTSISRCHAIVETLKLYLDVS